MNLVKSSKQFYVLKIIKKKGDRLGSETKTTDTKKQLFQAGKCKASWEIDKATSKLTRKNKQKWIKKGHIPNKAEVALLYKKGRYNELLGYQ